jgi:hypothetical protein
MKHINAIILYRIDLSPEYVNTNINDLTYEMFSHKKNGIMFHEDLTIFVDDNGAIRILNDIHSVLNAEKP